MRNLIFNSFCMIGGKVKSVNNNSRNAGNVYLKNSIVSLFSAKRNNPDCQVVLYTNEEIPDEYGFEALGIEVRVFPFDTYVMPENFRWSHAFYKLCCLRDAVNRGENDCIISLDTDTYIPYSLEPIWNELKLSDTIMLYDTNHRINHPVRKEIIQDYFHITGEWRAVPQYGGEFVGGSLKGLKILIEKMDNVYSRIAEKGFSITKDAGDEELLSMAAYEYTRKIQNAAPYVQRYWTRTTYLVSTNWNYDNVLIWHLPAEKNLGLNELYCYIIKKWDIPSVKKAAAICNLPKEKMPVNIQFMKRMIYKMKQ